MVKIWIQSHPILVRTKEQKRTKRLLHETLLETH
jgi:hypothetical protein